jgi:DNA-binding winged helix-turn-helix (wHTH) protein
VLVSMNSDVSDSWEREGDNRDYFETFARRGYALGVNVVIWVLTH